MMDMFTKSLEICQVGNPILRAKSEAITNVKDVEIQKLIDVLIKTLRKSQGVGIAAPQIGRSLRLLIIASHPNDRYPHAPKMQPIALINPQITSYCEPITKDWEGCLSVPNIRGLVPRYETVEVNYCDRYGQEKTDIFQGFIARILQHEYDHLDGKVFLDRVETSLDLVSESEYYKLIKNTA